MKTTTLSEEFKSLRKRRGLTLLEIAQKCDMAESTVWKIENHQGTRWETVHLCLSLALNCQPGTDLYQSMQALWVRQRQERAEHLGPDHNQKKTPPHTNAAIRSLRKILAGLDEVKTKAVVIAAGRAALR